MNDGGEVSASRTVALLKEAALSEAERRSAAVTLADIATVVTGWSKEAEAAGKWDEDTAKATLRKALEATGFLEYESAPPKRPISSKPIYDRRPGQ